MIHDPVEQGHDRYNSFISQFIQFQLGANTSGAELIILFLYLTVQLDLHTVTNRKLFAMFTVQLKNV